MLSLASRKWMFGLLCVTAITVAADAATISGEIKFEGKARRRKPIEMVADPKCAEQHKDVVLEDRYAHAENGNLINVFVYISKGVKDAPKPEGKVIIDQKGCAYLPHVAGVMIGQTVEIANSDPTMHNVNCKPETNSAFNKSMPGGTTLDVVFEKEEMKVPLKCDVHPWMGGYIYVLDHPFYSVSDKDGKFEIKGLPAGDYEVSVQYETSRYVPEAETIKVTVTAEETKTVDFKYSPK